MYGCLDGDRTRKINVEEILNKLIDFLYHQVMSSGGDGDATWVSKYYNVEKQILPFLEKYNSQLKYPWKIEFNKDKNEILWGDNQEWVYITNDFKWAEPHNFCECLIVY